MFYWVCKIKNGRGKIGCTISINGIVITATDLGYRWAGKISIHHSKLLPICTRINIGVRYFLPANIRLSTWLA